MAKLAQANIAENGSIYGVPGNQKRTPGALNGEMDIREIYPGFTSLFRFKDRVKAEEAAAFAVECVKNPLIGYSQGTAGYGENGLRTGLIYQCRKHHWTPEAIDEPCNCDCASFVMTCLHKVDIDVDETMYTGNEVQILRATGCFDEYEITPRTEYLVGDILWKRNNGSGHTAIVVEADTKENCMIVANCKSVNMRNYVGTDKSTILQTLAKGDEVVLTGKTAVWYECTFAGKTGWVSGMYLEKM